jgi:hypothetical protein
LKGSQRLRWLASEIDAAVVVAPQGAKAARQACQPPKPAFYTQNGLTP